MQRGRDAGDDGDAVVALVDLVRDFGGVERCEQEYQRNDRPQQRT
jgi:hypothetical protein